jgi:hypothetical protein
VDLLEAQAVLACLACLRWTRPEPAAHALADLVHRRDLVQASEALNRCSAKVGDRTLQPTRLGNETTPPAIPLLGEAGLAVVD